MRQIISRSFTNSVDGKNSSSKAEKICPPWTLPPLCPPYCNLPLAPVFLVSQYYRWFPLVNNGHGQVSSAEPTRLSIFVVASKNSYFKHRKVVFKGRKMWLNLQLSDSMFRSSRVLQITALLALSFGAGTLLFLTARYWKRKRREPSTGNSSSYNDRLLRRKRTLTSGNKQSGVRFVLNCVYIK